MVYGGKKIKMVWEVDGDFYFFLTSLVVDWTLLFLR